MTRAGSAERPFSQSGQIAGVFAIGIQRKQVHMWNSIARRRFITRTPPFRPCFPGPPRHVSWKLWLGGLSSFDAQDPRDSIGAVPSTVEGPKVLRKTTKTSDRPRRQSPSLVRGQAAVRPLRTIVSAGHGAESLGNKPNKMSPLSKRMPIGVGA